MNTVRKYYQLVEEKRSEVDKNKETTSNQSKPSKALKNDEQNNSNFAQFYGQNLPGKNSSMMNQQF